MIAGIFLALLVLALIVLDVLALLKAPDSREGVDSEEWELRRLWRSMR